MRGTDALEIVVLTTGVVTMAGAVASLVQGWLDRLALVHAGKNGMRHVVITTRLVREVSRLVASMVITGAALWCLWLPEDTHPVSLVLKHALMFIGWVLMVAVFSDWKARCQLEDLLERLERGERV